MRARQNNTCIMSHILSIACLGYSVLNSLVSQPMDFGIFNAIREHSSTISYVWKNLVVLRLAGIGWAALAGDDSLVASGSIHSKVLHREAVGDFRHPRQCICDEADSMEKNIIILPSLRTRGQNQERMFGCRMPFISVKNSQEEIFLPRDWGKEENLRAAGDHPVCLRLPSSWRFRESVGGWEERGKEGLWLRGVAEFLLWPCVVL